MHARGYSQGRRRLIVEVDDAQLRYNSPDFCHEAMTEFVELLVLPLTTALENLKVIGRQDSPVDFHVSVGRSCILGR